jgi:hypothetical protein
MSKREPTVWQECKAIAEALAAPTPTQNARELRAKILAQLAAGSEKDIELADQEIVRRLRAVLRTLTADQVASEEWSD